MTAAEHRTLNVPSMSCGHCRQSIEAALRPLPGVEAVEVDLARRQVTVTVRPGGPDPAALAAAIEAAGHEVSAP